MNSLRHFLRNAQQSGLSIGHFQHFSRRSNRKQASRLPGGFLEIRLMKVFEIHESEQEALGK